MKRPEVRAHTGGLYGLIYVLLVAGHCPVRLFSDHK